MQYNIEIYETDKLNQYRFALGSLSEKVLFVLGVNPSTADDKEPDPTMKQVMYFAKKHGYTSFVMFNLYPLRQTDPKALPEQPDEQMVDKNVEIIFDIISKQVNVDIWAAWGGDIDSRGYLRHCLEKIYQKLDGCSINWLRLGELLGSGHPAHPLYKSHDLSLQTMDMPAYLKS